MKTFWSIVGGASAVGLIGGIFAAIILCKSAALVVGGICGISVVSLIFYLGYDFTKYVILGGD